jgi:DNA-binding LacI/PurR family transcriptional regulator
MERISQADIAKHIGVSASTVSLALKNDPRISKQVRQKVLDVAQQLGYRPDPSVSALANYRWKSKPQTFTGEIAWINTWREPEKLRQHKEFGFYLEGATASAKRAGFTLQEFNTTDIPLHRLQSIFKARNIKGILIAPLEDSLVDWSSFPLENFASVRFGRTIPSPETHFVSSAQINNMILAFKEMRKLGYQRIGFACEWFRFRFFGIGFAWAQQNIPQEQQLPVLSLDAQDGMENQQLQLDRWIKTTQPDAILTDHATLPLMLNNLGYRVPEDIGLATTTIHDTTINAGIDQKPIDIGRAAVRVLVSLLSENNYGPPETYQETLIGGSWVNGSMLPPRP